MHDAPDLEPWRAEVHQQAQMHSSGTQLVQALRAMRPIQRAYSFQFHQDSLLDQQIDKAFACGNAVVHDDDSTLLFGCQSSLVRSR